MRTILILSSSDKFKGYTKLTVYSRWLLIVFVWLTIVPICLWSLRMEIVLWKEYFTFAAVRYGLISHPLAALGLAFSVGMILAVLIWQSRNILFGLSSEEKSFWKIGFGVFANKALTILYGNGFVTKYRFL